MVLETILESEKIECMPINNICYQQGIVECEHLGRECFKTTDLYSCHAEKNKVYQIKIYKLK